MRVFVKMRIGESRGYAAFRRDQLIKNLQARMDELMKDDLFDSIEIEDD